MVALSYEGFVRGAFSLNSSTLIERSEDPAKVAEVGYWNSENISKVKVGTAYAITAYSNQILETSTLVGDEYDQLHNNLENLLNYSLQATSLRDLESIIQEARTYVDQYITFSWSN